MGEDRCAANVGLHPKELAEPITPHDYIHIWLENYFVYLKLTNNYMSSSMEEYDKRDVYVSL